MSKRLASILAALCLAGCLAGCSTEPASDNSQPSADANTPSSAGGSNSNGATTAGGVIYGIYKAGDQTWFIDEGDAAQAAAEAAGYSFTYVDAKMNPDEYLKAIDNAIANKAAGIVTCIPDQTMSQAVIDKCEAANMPVVAADDALEINGEKLAPWVGISAYKIGEANGEWLANYAKANNLNGPDVGLLLMTMDTVSSCVPRAEGEYDKFTELFPDFDTNLIFRADYDGTTDKGNTAAAAVITAHPEIKTWLVTGANDEGCIGAARALESAGLDGNACVVGLGAYMAKDEFKKEGGSCVKAAAYFSAEDVGAGSIEILTQMINGETPVMETAVDAVVVTPENYQEVMGKYAE